MTPETSKVNSTLPEFFRAASAQRGDDAAIGDVERGERSFWCPTPAVKIMYQSRATERRTRCRSRLSSAASEADRPSDSGALI